MEEKNEPIISYKIMAGRKYRVFKQTFDKNGSGDKVFYKIQMFRKCFAYFYDSKKRIIKYSFLC